MAKKILSFPMKMDGTHPVCSDCGGSVQCTGVLNCSMVDVDADVYEDTGEVQLTYDYMDAGAAEFVPTDFRCVDCGAILTVPEDLRADAEIEEE